MVEDELKPKQKKVDEEKEKAPVDLTDLYIEVKKVFYLLVPNPLSHDCRHLCDFSITGTVIDENGHNSDNG